MAYGLILLPIFGISVVPDSEMLLPLTKVGLSHLLACRLFVVAVCGDNKIPVSFAQTIRAANPIFTVLIMFCLFGTTFKPKVLLSLLPLVGGFALAALSEMSFNMIGFLCAIGSVTTLVLVNV